MAREYNREVTSGAKISACYWPDLAPIERLRSALQFPLGQQCRKVCSGIVECFSKLSFARENSLQSDADHGLELVSSFSTQETGLSTGF